MAPRRSHARFDPLPLELAPALRARRHRLADLAEGRVLDLGGWSDHLDHYHADRVTSLVLIGATPARADLAPVPVETRDLDLVDLVADEAGAFDTVVSLIRTPLVADLEGWLALVDRVLAPEGRFLFCEPTRRPGRTGRLLAAFAPLVRATAGLHLDRDVPAAVRAAGFTITDLDRFEVPTVSAPLRPFVEGRARRRHR
ncbi:MAG: methyltransferase domain-containing protein [Actinomyces sp.]|nr:MAG: methyltransferase domain-containing protein [Actinomyces sp.]